MRVISWNVNGIRAASRRGSSTGWSARNRRALSPGNQGSRGTGCEEGLSSESRSSATSATGTLRKKKGYSGVATFSLTPPLFVTKGVDFERNEGRVIVTEHGGVTIYNIYFPNGRQRDDGPDPDRLGFKLEFYETLYALLAEERESGKSLLICGDWNTAFAEIDLARPKENRNVTGFLDE